MSAVSPRVAVAALTLIMMAASSAHSLQRYDQFGSGFSWDLAYYNQWFWAVTRGDGLLTVRPGSAYAFEGPSVWKMNYLAPIRLAILPLYAMVPGPRTLLLVQNAVFWLVIPAAFSLVRAECRSDRLALAAAALVPLTPLMWPLALNDFRELQLACPFVLWTIQGWRERRSRLATVGIAGLLACRQEFALMLASLPLLPPQNVEAASQRRTWTVTAIVVGLGWFIVFLGYLAWRVDPHAPADYLAQFTPKSSLGASVGGAIAILLGGLASWAVVATLAPRAALLALPWALVLTSGQWSPDLIATRHWHHVRYTVPMAALMLAAGLIGFARTVTLSQRFRGRLVPLLWSVMAVGLIAGTTVLERQFAKVPRPISREERLRLWSYIADVGPADGVLASYDVAAPLSSRRWLYSYARPENLPPGYPRLSPSIQWAFIRTGELPAQLFLQQGFVELDSGPYIHVFRRVEAMAQPQDNHFTGRVVAENITGGLGIERTP